MIVQLLSIHAMEEKQVKPCDTVQLILLEERDISSRLRQHLQDERGQVSGRYAALSHPEVEVQPDRGGVIGRGLVRRLYGTSGRVGNEVGPSPLGGPALALLAPPSHSVREGNEVGLSLQLGTVHHLDPPTLPCTMSSISGGLRGVGAGGYTES